MALASGHSDVKPASVMQQTVTNEINFRDGAWNAILEKAKAENKMIFIDCYTSWCGPCKIIAKTVFKDSAVAAFMNAHFISIKSDMEKGEGIELKKKFEVSAFPTLLFISPKGEVEHRIVGSVSIEKFIVEAKVALSGNGLAAYQRKYKSGVRDTSFLKRYIKVLDESYKKEELNTVVAEYLGIVGNGCLIDPDTWAIFKEYCDDPYSAAFCYVRDHQSLYNERYGADAVKQKLNRTWNIHAQSYLKKKGRSFVFDSKGFNKYLLYMEKNGVEDIQRIKFYALLNVNIKTEKWAEAASMIDDNIKRGGDTSLMMLYNWALVVDKQCAEASVRARAAAWVDLGISKSSDDAFSKGYLDAFVKLKESLSKPRVAK